VSVDRDLWNAAADLTKQGRGFVLVTVIKAAGSTPRNAGAKMLWRPPDNGEADAAGFNGTVGGGQFERLALDAAQAHFQRRSCGTEHFVLATDADQCCGGTMDVFFEYCGPRQRLVVFGAGHVSKALAEVLRAAALELLIVDDRAEWNTHERFPAARRLLSWDEGVAAATEQHASTLACVMTCSHDTDLELLRRLNAEPSRVPAFVGLIGSESKKVCLFRRLVASGIDDGLVNRIHCPIGLGDMGKEPELVAVSIAGQILLEAKRLGAPAR